MSEMCALPMSRIASNGGTLLTMWRPRNNSFHEQTLVHPSTHPPLLLGPTSVAGPGTMLPSTNPTQLSFVPVAAETVVGEGSPTRVRRAVAMPSTFSMVNMTWRCWLAVIRAQRHRSAEATPPYGTCITARWSAPDCY